MKLDQFNIVNVNDVNCHLESVMIGEVLFVYMVHKDCLVMKSFYSVWSDISRPLGTWEFIDLQRDCTHCKLSEGNEAQPAAIFSRNVLELCLLCVCWGG